MPRGDNPNSRANLKKSYNGKGGFDSESAREAKKKSDKAKIEYKTLTENLKAQCTPEVMAELTLMLIRKAKAGNLKAYELIRDQCGEKPIEKLAVSTVNEESLDRLQSAIAKRRKNE